MSLIVTPDRRTFEVRRELIDVTSLRRPDERWRHVDPAGHLHQWEWPDGRRVYQPDKRVSLPTLRWIVDGTAYWPDGEPYEYGHYECALCGAHVEPRSVADTTTQHIAGIASCYIDGQPVSREDFITEFERSTGKRIEL